MSFTIPSSGRSRTDSNSGFERFQAMKKRRSSMCIDNSHDVENPRPRSCSRGRGIDSTHDIENPPHANCLEDDIMETPQCSAVNYVLLISSLVLYVASGVQFRTHFSQEDRFMERDVSPPNVTRDTENSDNPTKDPSVGFLDKDIAGSGQSVKKLSTASLKKVIGCGPFKVVNAARKGSASGVAGAGMGIAEKYVEKKIGADTQHFSKGCWDLVHFKLLSACRHFFNFVMDFFSWLIGGRFGLKPSGQLLGNVLEGTVTRNEDLVQEGLEKIVECQGIDIADVDGDSDECTKEEETPSSAWYQILRFGSLTFFAGVMFYVSKAGWL